MAKAKTVAAPVRRTRGPSIARTTPSGAATAYAIKKALWSHRGPVRAKGVKGLEEGEIQKSSALAILAKKSPEGKAPFVAKKAGTALVLMPA